MTCKAPVTNYAASANESAAAAIAQLPSYSNLIEFENDPVSRLNSDSVNSITAYTQFILTKHDLSDFPMVNNRINQSQLTPNEIADFTVTNSYDVKDLEVKTQDIFLSIDQNTETISIQDTDPTTRDYIQELEYYYTDNLGGAITYGVCSIFGAVGFAFAAITAIKAGIKKISELRNFTSAQALATINSLGEKMKDAVEQMFKKFKTQLENVVKNSIATIQGLASNAQELFKKANKMAKEAEKFFEDGNMKVIQDKIEEQLASLASQFENIDAKKILFIMFRACKLSSEIEKLVKRPVDGLKGVLEKIVTLDKVFKTNDYRQSINSVVNGNWRIPAEERKRRTEQAAARINSRNGIELYPTINTPISTEEMEMVSNLTEDGNDYFSFSDSVKNMGIIAQNEFQNTGILEHWDDTENYDDFGWKYIVIHRPEVFVKLYRVGKRLNKKLTVNSAYRSPWYNLVYLRQIQGNTGASKNSMHMYGNALDIAIEGSLTHADLIKAASLEGFQGIGLYNTFVHIDTNSNRRTWIQKSSVSEQEKQYLLAHSSDKFRKGLA